MDLVNAMAPCDAPPHVVVLIRRQARIKTASLDKCVSANDSSRWKRSPNLMVQGSGVSPNQFAPVPGIWTSETRAMVRDLVERVVVCGNEIEIILKAKAEGPAVECVTGGADDAAQSVLKIRLPDARPRARKEIIVPAVAGSAVAVSIKR